MITDNVPPVPPIHQQHRLLASLTRNEGFRDWFLPELQRKARMIQLDLMRNLTPEETAKQRAQYALLEELWGLAAQRETALKGLADAAAAGPAKDQGLG